MSALAGLFGVEVRVLTAEQQKRTPRDVRGPWVRPKCRSKAKGRKGTRRGWKRLNPPHRLWFYREPEDVLKFNDPLTRRPTIIVTPRQKAALVAATQQKDRSNGAR